jgi:chromosome segregation ATPase
VKGGYFPTLLACGTVSIFLLIVATLFRRDVPWLAIIAGCLPLVYYHLVYLWPRAKTGLSQAAIDSVYYFGFLVTLAALSISAVSIALQGASADVVIVVYQFGAGLAATGYAVFARMHLSSLGTMLDSTSPEAVMDRYLQMSLRLVDNAEAACARLAEFSKKIVQQSAELETVTKQRMERVLLETAGVFARELTSSLADANKGLVEVRNLANDLTFTASRVELSKAINGTLRTTNHLNAAMEELAQKSQATSAAMTQHTGVAQATATAIFALGQDMSSFAGAQGTLPKSVASLQMASDALKTGSQDLSEAMVKMREMRDATSEALPALKNMRSLAKKANDQIDTFAVVVERFGAALDRLTPASESAGKLTKELDSLAIALPPLSNNATTLAKELGLAGEAARRLDSQIGDLPTRGAAFVEMGAQLETALQNVAAAVTAILANARDVETANVDSAKAIEAWAQLVTHANGLKNVIGDLERNLGMLGASVQSNQQTVSHSTESLKTGIARSADLLKADVERSGRAVTLLTDRLTQVAQTIIDRTRQHQGAAP